MSFKFKLARRLAMIHVAGAGLITAVGCAGTDTLTPSDPGSGTPIQISITPRTARVAVGQTLQLAAFSRSQGGDSVPVEVQWTASGGTIAPSGAFSSLTPGTYWIFGRDSVAARGSDSVAIVVDGGMTGDPGSIHDSIVAPPVRDSTPAPAYNMFYPHQPAGLQRVAENGFDGIPGSGAGTELVGPGGSWEASGENLATVSDPSAPQSAASVLQVAWRKGLHDGAGNHGYFNCVLGRDYRELYVSWRVKIPSRTFENQLSPGVKLLGYISYGKSDRRNQFFLQMLSTSSHQAVQAGPWRFRSDFTSEYALPGTSNPAQDYFDNQGTPPEMAAGSWQQVEMYFKLNDDGRENGVYKLWINGALVQSYYDVTMISSAVGATRGFYQIHFDPIWGGHIGQVKQRDDALLIDHLYISGVPQ